jgi:hypothetical protein
MDEVGAEKIGRLFLNGARLRYLGAAVGLVGQVAIGLVSLRAGVIAGGAVTAFCGLGEAAGPVLGAVGNLWGIRAALALGALGIGPAAALYARAMAHEGREPELEGLSVRLL